MNIVVQQDDEYGFSLVRVAFDELHYQEGVDYIFCPGIDQVRQVLRTDEAQLFIGGTLGHKGAWDTRIGYRLLRRDFPLLVCVGYSDFEMRVEVDRHIIRTANSPQITELKKAVRAFEDMKLTRIY